MFVSKMKIPFSRLKVCFCESRFVRCYNRKIDTVAKRGSVLEDLVKNKDRRKNWALNLQSIKPKVRLFDGVHMPHRRKNVLNSLFIRNITDVLSTEEVVPELYAYQIQISGVQISPCFKIVNVFWQVPESKYDCCEEIQKLLAIAAPRIRAELISRNVLGKVPHIFFLRDCTNLRIAEFEQAMEKLEAEPKTDPCLVVDDSFTKDMMSFRDKVSAEEVEKEQEEEQVEPVKSVVIEVPLMPLNPPDMKCDVFGLDHDTLMNKVIALKKKKREPVQKTAVIDPGSLDNDDDLFSKIPGICFRSDPSKNSKSREALLKQFHIERKKLKEMYKNRYTVERYEYQPGEDDDDESNSLSDDYLEEETKNN